MPDPHDPLDDVAARRNDAVPPPGDEESPPLSRGGRPSKLTAELVENAMDELQARDGVEPSVRQLQEVLGGGRTRLTALRDEVRGSRLVATAAPEGEPLGKALSDVLASTLRALGVEAARAASALVETARVEADGRVKAAERVRRRACQSETDMALERNHAQGRVDELEKALAVLLRERDATAQALAESREREAEIRDVGIALGRDLAEQRKATERAEATAQDLRAALTASEAAGAELRATSAAQASTLAETGARLDAALARADELGARVARLEPERDTARDRAERLDAGLEAAQRDAHAARTAAEAARRTELDLHAHLGRLEARLLAAGVPAGEIEPVPASRVAEDQAALDFGTGDGEGNDRPDEGPSGNRR